MKSLKIILLFITIIITGNVSAQTNVFITNQGKSYHKKDCRLLPEKHIKTTIKKAKTKGYLACKVCVPKVKGEQRKVVSKKVTKKNIATRCIATTQKGTQCKRRTKNTSGRCWQHN
ncbi:hypothetical protein KCTC32516_01798 [Polaribacter huanghezhanensis]|uniref:hypothetical protein n=1 Tax=Polaribacter huanghezhanensis TaxID=1354726 RepID=UPI002649FF71|nr:hypothetical protein [Polaribacter huanghezhanensis]WKD86423.1 hypothetical protein KCTC32516_01798 [Polaribacter huanghezhanensis]